MYFMLMLLRALGLSPVAWSRVAANWHRTMLLVQHTSSELEHNESGRAGGTDLYQCCASMAPRMDVVIVLLRTSQLPKHAVRVQQDGDASSKTVLLVSWLNYCRADTDSFRPFVLEVFVSSFITAAEILPNSCSLLTILQLLLRCQD